MLSLIYYLSSLQRPPIPCHCLFTPFLMPFHSKSPHFQPATSSPNLVHCSRKLFPNYSRVLAPNDPPLLLSPRLIFDVPLFCVPLLYMLLLFQAQHKKKNISLPPPGPKEGLSLLECVFSHKLARDLNRNVITMSYSNKKKNCRVCCVCMV